MGLRQSSFRALVVAATWRSVKPFMEMPEEERLQSLVDLNLLDTPDELEYDQLVELASEICNTPISLVSLVDSHRQWFKAAVGLSTRETSREVSFCSHAIRQPELFIVEDAASDERFKDNALVTGDPNIRFYAGIPIHSPEGAAVGTLCVIDTQPRTLDEGQRKALTILGLQVQARMDLRRKKHLLEKTLADNIRLTENLQATNALFEKFMENGPFVSYIKDTEGRFLFFKSHLAERFGIANDRFLGHTIRDFFPPSIAEAHRENDLKVMTSRLAGEFSEDLPDVNGELLHCNSYKFPLQGPNGETLLAGISVDVTLDLARQRDLAKASEQLELLARIEPLTGLFNRRVFQERIEIEFATAVRKGRTLSLMILDIDNFKKRNDEFGHADGDECLRFLAQVLQDCVRKSDLAVRLGGEEFGILLPETEAAAAVPMALRIQKALRLAPGPSGAMTVSIGIASTKSATENWGELFSQSDAALYEAKGAGKDRVKIHGIFEE